MDAIYPIVFSDAIAREEKDFQGTFTKEMQSLIAKNLQISFNLGKLTIDQDCYYAKDR